MNIFAMFEEQPKQRSGNVSIVNRVQAFDQTLTSPIAVCRPHKHNCSSVSSKKGGLHTWVDATEETEKSGCFWGQIGAISGFQAANQVLVIFSTISINPSM